MRGKAVLSDCRKYRYRLERRSGHYPGVTAVIMVNPSRATATKNDHTITKLQGFQARWGWGRIVVGNLFAYRATDVNDLKTAIDPVGPDNPRHLKSIMAEADRVIVAWGRLSKLPKKLRNQWKTVVKIAEKLDKPLYCLGVCQDGHPVHPLTIPYERKLELWVPPVKIS